MGALDGGREPNVVDVVSDSLNLFVACVLHRYMCNVCLSDINRIIIECLRVVEEANNSKKCKHNSNIGKSHIIAQIRHVHRIGLATARKDIIYIIITTCPLFHLVALFHIMIILKHLFELTQLLFC